MNEEDKTEAERPKEGCPTIGGVPVSYEEHLKHEIRCAQQQTQFFAQLAHTLREDLAVLQQAHDINHHAVRSLLQENRELRQQIDALQQGAGRKAPSEH